MIVRFGSLKEWKYGGGGNEKDESHYHQNAPIKLVMYYSDIECSPCAINNLKEYNDIYKKQVATHYFLQ